MDKWIDNIIGLILTAWLIVLCVIMGTLCVISTGRAEDSPASKRSVGGR